MNMGGNFHFHNHIMTQKGFIIALHHLKRAPTVGAGTGEGIQMEVLVRNGIRVAWPIQEGFVIPLHHLKRSPTCGEGTNGNHKSSCPITISSEAVMQWGRATTILGTRFSDPVFSWGRATTARTANDHHANVTNTGIINELQHLQNG